MGAVGLAHVHMDRPVVKEGIGAAGGELHEVGGDEDAAGRMAGHAAHAVDGDDRSGSRFFSGAD